MKLFQVDHSQSSERHQLVYARFEIAYTLADFMAAVLFIVGSLMFFYEAWVTTGTWLFLIGSVLFATKPSLRLMREICLYRMGDLSDLAKDAAWSDPSSGKK